MSRVAILGAGVVGLSTALAVQGRGCEVRVFDVREAGRGSSWAGAGILYPLLPWDYDETVNDWCARGIAMHADWLEGLRHSTGVDPEYRVSGMRVVAGVTSAAIAWLRRHGQAFSREGADLWLPAVAQVRNPRLVEALLAACRRAGIEVRSAASAAAPRVDAHGIAGVSWAGGQWDADAVVVCAGAWSGGWTGIEVPVFPVRGQMLALQAPEVPPAVVYDEGRYLVPRRDGVVLVGSTMEHAGFDETTTPRAAASLLAWAGRMHPALGRAPVVRHWAGLRPGSRLNHPLVGPSPDWPRLWLNTGHFRYGLTMAPACAEALASQVAATG